MGGTSTDVSHFAGAYERTSERAVAGVRVRAPMLEIHTVAAGGGSICAYDGRRFRVGPDSAGAVPGPACYRRGGPLTITDCNVVLGKIRPEHFPRVFGPDGDQPIDAGASLALCEEIAARAGMSAREAAEGFVRIAVDNMANAIKQISIARGHDVTRYTLQCFGGAGGQHACLVADALGIECVMIHPLAGVLSAYGMGLADMVEIRPADAGRGGAGDGAGGAGGRGSSGAGGAGRRDGRRSCGGRRCVTKAAIRAWKCRFRIACGRISRRRIKRASASPRRRLRWSIETAIVEARSSRIAGKGDRVAAWWRGSGGGQEAPPPSFGRSALPEIRGRICTTAPTSRPATPSPAPL